MMNIYNFSKNVFQDIKLENKNNPVFVFIILALLTIPLAMILSSISLGFLVVATAIYFKKSNFKFDNNLVLPIILYFLMLLSITWTVDFDRTATALLKQIPLLIIPVCFMVFQSFTENQKQKIIP